MLIKRLSVLAPSLALTSIVAVSSALAKIAQAFPEVPVSSVQMLTALPSLIAIPVILLSGWLSAWITKKRIVVLSSVLLLAGGLLPVLLHGHFWQLVLASVLFGLGFGGISPITTALITEHYPTEEQPTMLGFQTAVIGIGGALFSFLGGKLAANCWWHTYYAYLLFVPMLLLVLLLPKGTTTEQTQRGGFVNLWNRRLVFYVCQGLCIGVLLFAFQANIALLLESRGLGGSEVAGSVLSVHSVFGIISGVLGGKIIGRLRRMSMPVIFVGAGLAFLLIFLARGMALLYFAAACLGFVFSLRMPAGYLNATRSVKPAFTTLAITVYCSASQVGQFLSPVFTNAMQKLLGLQADQKFPLAALFLLLIGGISIWREYGPGSKK